MDSDDALETDILQRAAATQESFDADMVIFGHADIVQEHQRINRRDYSTNNLIDYPSPNEMNLFPSHVYLGKLAIFILLLGQANS